MPVMDGYTTAVVIVDRHEPDHEATARLLELAEEKGYDPRTVEAQRGEHDAALSFRVPKDVADAFDAERADRWPSTAKIKNEDEKEAEQRHLPGDAYAADYLAAADAARTENGETTDDTPKPD